MMSRKSSGIAFQISISRCRPKVDASAEIALDRAHGGCRAATAANVSADAEPDADAEAVDQAGEHVAAAVVGAEQFVAVGGAGAAPS